MSNRNTGVKNGGTLLSVHCDTSDQVSRTKDLLKGTGAIDISATGESAGGGVGRWPPPESLKTRYLP